MPRASRAIIANDPTAAAAQGLRPRYEAALVASGFVDDVTDILALDARPCRFSEGDFVCRHGDAAEALWVIVLGSVSVREGSRTLFMRRENEVVGEQNILGNGCRRWYDLVVSENQVELLRIDKRKIEEHPQADIIWRNVAKIISLKLRDASNKTSTLSQQLEDNSHILRAYTNEYALGRRLQSGSQNRTDYRVHCAIIWFSDVVDFSMHTVHMPPSRTADIVQRFFNAQSMPIAAHGGHVDKFIGDGMMAFWVLAESEPADLKCLQALRAAEEAIKAVAEIRIGDKPLHLRIGLHIGMVLSGDFGSTTRHQFTLIGPEVNKAARLEQVHPEDILQGSQALGAIRLSAEFHKELSEPIKKRYRRAVKAKAKNIGEIALYC